MQPARYTLNIWKGATFYKRLTYKDGGVDDNPKDLTGFTGTLTIKDVPGGSELLALTSPTDIVFGGVAGTIDVTIASSVTSALDWTQGVYELFITSPSPESRTDIILSGPVVVRDI